MKADPFVVASSLLSFTSAQTRAPGSNSDTSYNAFDLRLGAVVGTTLCDRLSPYALARIFGGPI